MNVLPLLAGAIALALSACSPSPAPETTPAPSADATLRATGDASEPALDAGAIDDPVATHAPMEGDGQAAEVAGCATTVESDDAMQYDVDAIVIPAGCASFTIHLRHVGKLPVGAMGHNVVIAREADMPAIVADGMAVTPQHIKPGDARVLAHTDMIGGGGSTSVTFDVALVREGGPYRFFCSFPGHLARMQGSLQVQ